MGGASFTLSGRCFKAARKSSADIRPLRHGACIRPPTSPATWHALALPGERHFLAIQLEELAASKDAGICGPGVLHSEASCCSLLSPPENGLLDRLDHHRGELPGNSPRVFTASLELRSFC